MLKKFCLVSALFIGCTLSTGVPVNARTAPTTLQVNINGVNEEIESAIRAEIALPYLHMDPALSESTLDYYIGKAVEDITLSLQAYGYYHPVIHTKKAYRKNRWHITFNIKHGEPVMIENINVRLEGPGIYHPALKNVHLLMPIKSGDTLNHQVYEDGKKALLNAVIFEGYLEAEYTEHRIEVDTKQATAEILLVLDTKDLYFFGPTSFTDSRLAPRFLKRFVPYCSGDPYSAQQVLNFEEGLRRSDYFNQVNVSAAPNADTKRVPVIATIEDIKPNHYLFGIGYGTDTGARGKAGYLRRRVNSLGHRFHSELQLSELYQKIEADYVIPGKRPQSDYYKLYSKYIEDEYAEKPVDSFEITLSEKREIYGWDRIIGLSFIQERSVFFSTYQPRRDQLLIPFIEIKKTESDNPNNPTRGKTRIIRVKGSHKDIASDVSFLQLYYQERWLHAFDWGFKSLLRLELGATLPRMQDELPLSQRFFAGGDASIRGFAYRSLPAEIDNDGIRQPVGGSYLAVGSIEISKLIYGPVAVHTFVDAGNAFRTRDDNIQVGVGGGISYNTRLGPIKISVAKPITDAAHSLRLHATFGPEI